MGSGVAIKYRMLPTETQAKKQERYFKKGLQRRIELITNILSLSKSDIRDYRAINMIFQRNFIIDNNDERKIALEEIAFDLVSRIEYRMKFHNETFEEAKKALEQLMKAKREEIEDEYTNAFGRIENE